MASKEFLERLKGPEHLRAEASMDPVVSGVHTHVQLGFLVSIESIQGLQREQLESEIGKRAYEQILSLMGDSR